MRKLAISLVLTCATVPLPAFGQVTFSTGGTSSTGGQVMRSAPGGGYPIGTTSGAAPTFWGALGTPIAPNFGNAAPPGYVNLYNNPGMGYYTMSPYSQQFPAYPAPVSAGGGYFQFGGAGAQNGYWRAPSGYYYPWCPAIYVPNATYPVVPQIYSLQQGALAPAKPPVGMVIKDMRQFVEDAHSKNQLDRNNYEHLFNRLNSVTEMAAELAAKNDGVLDSSDEANVRRELDLLSTEIARALTP